MSRNAIIAVLVVIVLAGLAWWLISNNKSSTSSVSQQPTESPVMASPTSEATSSSMAGPNAQTANTISITSSGFSPSDLTVKAGSEVTWTNNDSAAHQVNSDPHPTHTAYPPLNSIGRLQPGQSKSLTFPKAGTYKYHDHLDPTLTGTVTVQ